MILAAFPIGDPTVVGWTTFALYLLASAYSLHCGLIAGRFENHGELGRIWCVQAGVLLLLGLNKQLDLQTPLIELGRRLAIAAAWYEYRREIQLIFFVGLVAVLVLVVMKRSKAVRSFARKHPLVVTGDTLVGSYVLIRTISIDHVDGTLGFDLENVPGIWLVEILGLLLVVSGALQARLVRTSP